MSNGFIRVKFTNSIKGLVLNKPLDAMLPSEAFTMLNLIPDVDGDKLRPGFDKCIVQETTADQHPDWGCSFISGSKKQLVYHDAESGHLVACNIVPGQNVLSPVDSTADAGTEAKFTSTQFTDGGGGQNLFVCGDASQYVKAWDGTTWADAGYTLPADVILTNPCAYKNRMYFCGRGTTKIYYGGLQAISGDLTPFDISAFMQRGGAIAAIVNWRVNSSVGIQNVLAIITTEGEVLVYNGDDPEADNWALSGVYSISRPFNFDFHEGFASDVIVCLESGIYLLGQLLPQDGQNISELSGAINPKWQDTENRIGSPRWIRSLGCVIITDTPAQQYVYNVRSGAWCTWSGLETSAPFIEIDDNVYFFDTSNGIMILTPRKYTDYNSSNTDRPRAINYYKQMAYFAAPDNNLYQAVRIAPFVDSDSIQKIYKTVFTDFKDGQSSMLGNTATGQDGATWDISAWDEDFWASDTVVELYKGVNNARPARYVSVGLFGASMTRLKLMGMEVTFKVATGDI